MSAITGKFRELYLVESTLAETTLVDLYNDGETVEHLVDDENDTVAYCGAYVGGDAYEESRHEPCVECVKIDESFKGHRL